MKEVETVSRIQAGQVTEKHYGRHDLLQRVCFPEEALRDIAVGHVSSIDTREVRAGGPQTRRRPLRVLVSRFASRRSLWFSGFRSATFRS